MNYKLKKGDKIGFYSPSLPATVFAKSRFVRACDYLMAHGLELQAGSLTGKITGYCGGSIDERINELNELILNDDVKMIMSTVGGSNSNAMVAGIDYAAILNNPKIFIGYSDTSAILLAIYQKTKLVTFYGPSLVANFGEFPPLVDDTYRYFERLFLSDEKLPICLATPEKCTNEFVDWEEQSASKTLYNNHLTTIKNGVVTGRLLGGNLQTIYGIFGSEYMPDFEVGDILFVEDTFISAAEVERGFAFLKLSKVFEKVSGIILGKYDVFNDQGTGKTPAQILLEVIGDVDIPILADFDCGHTHPMHALPIGGIVTLDSTKQTVTIESL